MSERIQFEDDQSGISTSFYEKEMSKITGWVIKYSRGLVKDQRQAGYVLLIFAVLVFIISLFLFFKRDTASHPYTPPLIVPAHQI